MKALRPLTLLRISSATVSWFVHSDIPDQSLPSRIQVAIREEFQDSILLTIAHRLRTVIGTTTSRPLRPGAHRHLTPTDYDRILVMDAGKGVFLLKLLFRMTWGTNGI